MTKHNYLMLFARNTSCSTLSGLRDTLKGVTTFPDLLNNHSEEALVAGTVRYFLASLARIG